MAEPKSKKLAFVTIGATAGFDSLIAACLDPVTIRALANAGYNSLRIQYGKEGQDVFEALKKNIPKEEMSLLDISGFDFTTWIDREMLPARSGVVISHAGSGSILAALRMDLPLIVVPNPTLLDNHQVELAEVLAKQGYLVHGSLDNIPAAIEQAEVLRNRPAWPPVNSGVHRKAKNLPEVIDEEVGSMYLD